MARARNIKPSFFTNDRLGELEPLARLLFVGLWTIADYKGCLEFRPKRIKAQILPYDECNIEELAIDLDKSGFVQLYSVNGERYLKIVNFEKHQNPHKNEREAGSDIPDIGSNKGQKADSGKIQINPEKDGTAPADSPFLIPDSKVTTLSGKPDALKVLEHLNQKAGRKFQPVKANLNIITARLKEYSFEQLIAVVDEKCAKWRTDAKMAEYLRPETLFNATKCASYVGSLGVTQGKPWYVGGWSAIQDMGDKANIRRPKDNTENEAYKQAVMRHYGVTEEMRRQAMQDFA